MKIKCDFCKTEYMIPKIPAVPVKCAICGHSWMIKTRARKNPLLLFLAALCALISAVIFSIVAVSTYRSHMESKSPLAASIVKTELAPDGNGINHFIVSGIIENRSDEFYSPPNIIVLSYDENGKQIGSGEQFTPPVPILESGARAAFVYTLRAPSAGVKKISVKLGEFEK